MKTGESFVADSGSSFGSELSSDIMTGGGKVSVSKGESFLSYMSTITEQDKTTILNLGQYILLAIVPITILLKLLAHFSPIQDPSKGSIELLIEVVMQLLVVVIALYFIHKMILYLPTYSKKAYEHVNFTTIVLPFIFLLFTLDTNIGDKVNVLLERVMVMIGLKKENFENEEYEEKINTPTSLVLDPPVGNSMMPMNTAPEVNRAMSHPSTHAPTNMGTQCVPETGSALLQNEVMAANSFGGFSPF